MGSAETCNDSARSDDNVSSFGLTLYRAVAVAVVVSLFGACVSNSSFRKSHGNPEAAQRAVSQLVETESSLIIFERKLRAFGATIVPGDRVGKMSAVIPLSEHTDPVIIALCVDYLLLPNDRFVYLSQGEITLQKGFP